MALGVKHCKKLIIIRWASLPKHPVLLPHRKTLGNRLKGLRSGLGLTRAAFATLCGHTQSTVGKYEQNRIKKPNLQILLDFAKALKVSPEKVISIQCFQPISNETEFDSLLSHSLSPKDFGLKFRDLRIRANINQKVLAEKVGINRESIRRYEKNESRPSKKRLSQIIKVLKEANIQVQEQYYHKT